MNALIVGSDKSPILDRLPKTFLIIDDGPVIDALDLPKRAKTTVLNFSRDCLNVLERMSFRKAMDFIDVLNAVFPEGENTLTKKNANFVLLNAMLPKRQEQRPSRLDELVLKPGPGEKDTGKIEAYQKIQTLLLSPVLKKFLANRANHTNFSLDGILIARLDRTVLHPFEAFVIANLLISNYPGTVVIPDFGFYGCKFHRTLIDQERLVAGVNYLDEPKEEALRKHLLLIEDKIASRCTADDAETLASYCSGFPKGTDGYSSYVKKAIDGF